MGLSFDRIVKLNTLKLVVVASPLRMQHYGEIAKTEWGHMFPADCCVSELALLNAVKSIEINIS